MKDKKLKLIATKKQIKQIRKIEDTLDIKFKGKTEEDVSSFIDLHKKEAKDLRNGNISIPVYSASYNRGRKEWIESLNLKDTIAHEKFKGDILRGKNPEEALLRFGQNALIECLSKDSDEDDYCDYDDDYDDDFDYNDDWH